MTNSSSSSAASESEITVDICFLERAVSGVHATHEDQSRTGLALLALDLVAYQQVKEMRDDIALLLMRALLGSSDLNIPRADAKVIPEHTRAGAVIRIPKSVLPLLEELLQQSRLGVCGEVAL